MTPVFKARKKSGPALLPGPGALTHRRLGYPLLSCSSAELNSVSPSTDEYITRRRTINGRLMALGVLCPPPKLWDAIDIVAGPTPSRRLIRPTHIPFQPLRLWLPNLSLPLAVCSRLNNSLRGQKDSRKKPTPYPLTKTST